MAIMRLTLTYKDNRKKTYRLKTPAELADIDENKEAEFLFYDFSLVVGCSDGVVNDEGYFSVSIQGTPVKLAGLPFDQLLGWRYKSHKHNLSAKK